jgi:hypothetical protein
MPKVDAKGRVVVPSTRGAKDQGKPFPVRKTTDTRKTNSK